MENKNNKNLIIILLVIIVLLILAFGLYYYKNNHKVVNIKNQSKQIKQKVKEGMEARPEVDVDQLVGSIKKDYKQDPRFKECIAMGMGIQGCLRDVIMEKVRKEDNVNLCNDLVGDGEKQSCVDDYYREKAKKSGDESLCQKTSDKDSCLEGVITEKALNANDEQICDKLKEGYKMNCLVRVIRKKAVETNNPKLCEKLVYTRTEGEGKDKQEYKETSNAQMCSEEVKMEIEMRKEEEKKNAEMEQAEEKNKEQETK